MNDATIRRARETKYYQEGLRELGRHLPLEDEQLDRILAETAAAKDDLAFTHLILAALAAGRTVDARHLVEGAVLFPGLKPFASAALHCSGNVARVLAQALGRGGFQSHAETGVLAVAAVWCEAHPEEPMPGELISRARSRARELMFEDLPAIHLVSMARRTRDQGLQSILEKVGHWDFQELADQIIEPLLTASKASPLAHVPESPEALAISGYTVRRSAPRIGRNDPCPCGSGKKYKKCCYDKDQERLLHPSAVPGLTVEEWRAALPLT
jgi:SEC-C motif